MIRLPHLYTIFPYSSLFLSSVLVLLDFLRAFDSINHRLLCSKLRFFKYTQCGFRSNFSTSTALITVLDSIIFAVDSGKVSVLVLLDFSKAFDTINHCLLCSKLRFYGFKPDAVALIESYLSNRSQTIQFNNTSSANS